MEAELAQGRAGGGQSKANARKLLLLQFLARHGELGSPWLRKNVESDGLALSETLTAMVRNGEVEYIMRSRDEGRMRITSKGTREYMAILDSLRTSADPQSPE